MVIYQLQVKHKTESSSAEDQRSTTDVRTVFLGVVTNGSGITEISYDQYSFMKY